MEGREGILMEGWGKGEEGKGDILVKCMFGSKEGRGWE